MKKQQLLALFCVIFLLPFVEKAKGWDLPLNIDVINIKFDFQGSGDGLNIRINNSTDVTVPEWTSVGRRDPSAYVISQATVQVQAQFCNFEGEDVNSVVAKAHIDSSTGIGNLGTATVSFPGGTPNISSYVTFTSPSSNVPSTIGKYAFTWKWYVTTVNDSILESDADIGNTGTHTYYTVITTPQAPMDEPWTEVLDYSCDWASGKSTASSAATEITKKIYGNVGGIYDTIDGSYFYAGNYSTGSFNLSGFLNAIPSVDTLNCYDCGKALKIFSNAIGCNLVYQFSWPFGYVNCIKPIGKGWANNPFYDNPSYSSDPIVGEDDDSGDGRSSFGNHAMSARSGNVYDATLKVNTQVNPDTVMVNPPPIETWVIGQWNWSTYVSKVVDDNPSTETGNPTSYSFSVY